MEKSLEQKQTFDLLEHVKGASKIAIGGHIHPDGDCVGAVMAVYLYLKKALPKAHVAAYLEPPAQIFEGIKDFDKILNEPANEAPDVFIALDCASDRLGFARPLFEGAKKTVNIDHHISNKGCGTVSLIVPDAAATCEILYGIMDKAYLDAEIAKALYIGIIHDTGVLQYPNTSAGTLGIAAALMQFGFPFSEIIQKTFYEKTYCQTQILGSALLKTALYLENRCAVSMLAKEDMRLYGAQSTDLDGIVSQLRNIKGVDCAIFLYEMGKGQYKISMRSNHAVDVAKIALCFEGGGHVRAAGCTVRGDIEKILGSLLQHVKEQLR